MIHIFLLCRAFFFVIGNSIIASIVQSLPDQAVAASQKRSRIGAHPAEQVSALPELLTNFAFPNSTRTQADSNLATQIIGQIIRKLREHLAGGAKVCASFFFSFAENSAIRDKDPNQSR